MKKLTLPILLLSFSFSFQSLAQTPLPETKQIRTSEGFWVGFYTKYHFSEKWAYYGEYHMRRRSGIKDMAQIYLRFGATYAIAKYLDFTLGFANPFYWAPDQDAGNIDKVVPQYRIWEQAVLATPFDHIKVMHQLRVEHRWRRDFIKDSRFELTHRFRYKLTIYVPLNHKDFGPNTLFLALYDEVFVQAGKSVVFDHLEDNRAFVGLGYNLNEKFQFQLGYMNSFRHDGAPHLFESRNIIRFNVYHHLDFHLEKQPKARDIPIH